LLARPWRKRPSSKNVYAFLKTRVTGLTPRGRAVPALDLVGVHDTPVSASTPHVSYQCSQPHRHQQCRPSPARFSSRSDHRAPPVGSVSFVDRGASASIQAPTRKLPGRRGLSPRQPIPMRERHFNPRIECLSRKQKIGPLPTSGRCSICTRALADLRASTRG
jgi:hypothetical protein